MSGPKIDQKAYLKRYLSSDDPSRKKKKKKAKEIKGKSITIIDHHVDVDRLEKLNDEELEVFQNGEDAPQVVGVIDDRPAELRALDFKNSTRWKVIADDNGFESQLIVQETDAEGRIKKKKEKVKSVSFGGGSRNDDSDPSPPRKRRNGSGDLSPIRKQSNRSPERRKRRDSDASPPRRRMRDGSDPSPPRRSRKDSDASPPRQRRGTPDQSPPRRGTGGGRKAKDSDEDLSPVRKRGKDSPDCSPPRRRGTPSPPRRNRRSPPSPPRRERNRSRSPSNRQDNRKSRRKSDDSSPPRRARNTSPDHSPTRRRDRSSPSPPSHRDRPRGSPERRREKRRWDSPSSSSRDNRRRSPGTPSPPRRKRDSPTPSGSKKMEKTLDGKMAGLQSAKALRVETEKFRNREKTMFDTMDEDALGRNAEVVRRDRKTGRIRDMEAEMVKERIKDAKDQERKEIYDHWGKGVKQVEDHRKRREEEQVEMNKPVARYAGDADLEDYLKKQERDGDPMLAYMREKEREKRIGSGQLMQMPKYQGAYGLNRFNIAPGYRWDGVDRSNGYEKKYFDVQSKKKAGEEEAYRYSTEDM